MNVLFFNLSYKILHFRVEVVFRIINLRCMIKAFDGEFALFVMGIHICIVKKVIKREVLSEPW